MSSQAPTKTGKPRLIDEVRNVCRVRHLSPRTEKAYVQWIKRFIIYHGRRHPRDLGAEHIREFLSFLATELRVAASTQNQALCAVVFLYRHVVRKDIGDFSSFERARRPKRLPVVLTREEVKQVLEELTGTDKLIAQLLYGAGLRLSEALSLRVKDVDLGTGQILVRSGKGNRDRRTVLPITVKHSLTLHLDAIKAMHRKDLSEGLGETALPNALSQKYPDAVRFSFATHLIQSGYDIRTVQELLGHKSVKTTMICTHVLNSGGMPVRSPLDVD